MNMTILQSAMLASQITAFVTNRLNVSEQLMDSLWSDSLKDVKMPNLTSLWGLNTNNNPDFIFI